MTELCLVLSSVVRNELLDYDIIVLKYESHFRGPPHSMLNIPRFSSPIYLACLPTTCWLIHNSTLFFTHFSKRAIIYVSPTCLTIRRQLIHRSSSFQRFKSKTGKKKEKPCIQNLQENNTFSHRKKKKHENNTF